MKLKDEWIGNLRHTLDINRPFTPGDLVCDSIAREDTLGIIVGLEDAKHHVLVLWSRSLVDVADGWNVTPVGDLND